VLVWNLNGKPLGDLGGVSMNCGFFGDFWDFEKEIRENLMRRLAGNHEFVLFCFLNCCFDDRSVVEEGKIFGDVFLCSSATEFLF
jgi:hypothetical protein